MLYLYNNNNLVTEFKNELNIHDRNAFDENIDLSSIKVLVINDDTDQSLINQYLNKNLREDIVIISSKTLIDPYKLSGYFYAADKDYNTINHYKEEFDKKYIRLVYTKNGYHRLGHRIRDLKEIDYIDELTQYKLREENISLNEKELYSFLSIYDRGLNQSFNIPSDFKKNFANDHDIYNYIVSPIRFSKKYTRFLLSLIKSTAKLNDITNLLGRMLESLEKPQSINIISRGIRSTMQYHLRSFSMLQLGIMRENWYKMLLLKPINHNIDIAYANDIFNGFEEITMTRHIVDYPIINKINPANKYTMIDNPTNITTKYNIMVQNDNYLSKYDLMLSSAQYIDYNEAISIGNDIIIINGEHPKISKYNREHIFETLLHSFYTCFDLIKTQDYIVDSIVIREYEKVDKMIMEIIIHCALAEHSIKVKSSIVKPKKIHNAASLYLALQRVARNPIAHASKKIDEIRI